MAGKLCTHRRSATADRAVVIIVALISLLFVVRIRLESNRLLLVMLLIATFKNHSCDRHKTGDQCVLIGQGRDKVTVVKQVLATDARGRDGTLSGLKD
jgi:hypothetical protein